jgi:hypothetical protein
MPVSLTTSGAHYRFLEREPLRTAHIHCFALRNAKVHLRIHLVYLRCGAPIINETSLVTKQGLCLGLPDQPQNWKRHNLGIRLISPSRVGVSPSRHCLVDQSLEGLRGFGRVLHT